MKISNFSAKIARKINQQFCPHARHPGIETKLLALKMVQEGIGFFKDRTNSWNFVCQCLKNLVKKAAQIIKEDLQKKPGAKACRSNSYCICLGKNVIHF